MFLPLLMSESKLWPWAGQIEFLEVECGALSHAGWCLPESTLFVNEKGVFYESEELRCY
jgi:hypothetical protein